MTESENIPNNEGSSNFALPDGYFQKSASSILNKIEWEEEHKNCPVLLKLKGESGFILPENYFNSSEIGLELVDYAELRAISKKTGFDVPLNYFEESEMSELAKIWAGNKEELYSCDNLKSISKANYFVVEENYFSENAERLNAMLKEHQPSRIISILFPRASYAMAALLVITIGLWIYNAYFKPAETADCGTLACVDKLELVKTKNLENLDDDELYELVNSKSLEKKLQNKNDKTSSRNEDSSLKQVLVDDLLDEI